MILSSNQEQREWYIYTLADPRDEVVRYVGWTVNLRLRLRGHLHDAKRHPGSSKSTWLTGLTSAGIRPLMKIIYTGRGAGWGASESFLIATYRPLGNLLNVTSGGGGRIGAIPSPQTRKRMSDARRGQKRSIESRLRMSVAQRGIKKKKPTTTMNDAMSQLHPFRNKTHCKSGHLYDEKNTYYTVREKNGRLKRACRKCRALRQRAFIARSRKL